MRIKANLEEGKEYILHTVGSYETRFKCNQVRCCPEYSAIMCNVWSGWTFVAHGTGIYEDGTIDWDYSTGGHFVEVND